MFRKPDCWARIEPMNAACSLLTFGFAMILAACGTHAAISSATSAANPFDYMAALRKAENDVAVASPDAPARYGPLQMLSTTQSFVGEVAEAVETYPFAKMPATVSEVDRDSAREILEQHDVRDALEAIVAASRDRQIVILNEAHHVPRHRAFATLVMRELRKLGFEYFAAETFDVHTDALSARGYSLISDGYYNREPVFGDLIRQALAVGYKPVTYEHFDDVETGPDTDWVARIAVREEAQAKNLVDRVFAKDPKARIFIYVGYSHALKVPQELDGGRQNSWMAARLRDKTGIEPLSIDQATTRPVMEPMREAVSNDFAGDTFVLGSRIDASRFWTAQPGVDMAVFHREERIVNGRPHWLAMDGYRQPREIPAKLLPQTGRRLVQAFVANEAPDAVPMDQMLVMAGEKPPVFMLPKGKYRFAFQE
jgi:hypothetical protein